MRGGSYARKLGGFNFMKFRILRPGKFTGTGYTEAFKGKLRDGCLNANQFLSIEDARSKIEAWADRLQPASTAQLTGPADAQGVFTAVKNRGPSDVLLTLNQ